MAQGESYSVADHDVGSEVLRFDYSDTRILCLPWMADFKACQLVAWKYPDFKPKQRVQPDYKIHPIF